jgi:hypothetical protein
MSGGGGSGEVNFGPDALAAVAAGSENILGAGEADVCAQLSFDARLRSVDADAAEQLEIGEELRVTMRSTPRPAVVVYRHAQPGLAAETPVGALLDRLSELLPCLRLYDYEATVVSVNGGDVRVRVHVAA